MNIVVNDLLVNFQLTGKGKTVLLLHGWGDNSKGLSQLAKQLSENYQVLSLDLPGFGATQPPPVAWSLDDYGHFVQSTLNKLEIDQPYAVIGHSNGGALAIRSINLGSLTPEKLVLLAASGVRSGNKGKRLILKIIAKTGNLATIWMPERYRAALRKSLYGVAGSDAEVVPELRETFKITVRQDVQKDAANLDLPTLLIYAANDRAVPATDGRLYSKLIKNSQLEIIDDAEHFVHLDQPDRINDLIQKFLK